MLDRQPTKPNRYAVYDDAHNFLRYEYHERADEPTEKGDPLNKANLLPDEVVTALGLTGNPQVKDALGLLSRLNAGLGNEYVWKKSLNSYVEKRDSGSSKFTIFSENTYYAKISNFISINQTTGAVSLAEPITSISFTYSSFSESPFIGKYFSCSAENYANINYVPTSGYNVVRSNGREVDIYGTYSVTSRFNSVLHGYVNSPFPNAYPPAVSDGYTYTALNQLGDKAQIATGSYMGTGTYGSGNPNSVTAPFVPKQISIISSTGNYFGELIIVGSTVCGYGWSYSGSFVSFTGSINGNTISWYAGNAEKQLNLSGTTYYYVAIG